MRSENQKNNTLSNCMIVSKSYIQSHSMRPFTAVTGVRIPLGTPLIW